jgi:hypothetical protein
MLKKFKEFKDYELNEEYESPKIEGLSSDEQIDEASKKPVAPVTTETATDWGLWSVVQYAPELYLMNKARKSLKEMRGIKQGITTLKDVQGAGKQSNWVVRALKGSYRFFISKGIETTAFNQVTQKVVTNVAGRGLLNRIGTFMLGRGGTYLATSGSVVTFLLSNPYGWATLAVLATAGILVYTFWNPDMYEIDEIWKTKKHSAYKKDQITKQIYDLLTRGFYTPRIIGTRVIEKYKEISDSDNVGDNDFVAIRLNGNYIGMPEYYERYSDSIQDTLDVLGNSFVGTNIISTSNSSSDWIDDIKKAYDGLPISGKQSLDDYGTIKSFVTKHGFESSFNDANYYGTSIAEDSEGWFDTKFGIATPGLNVLGWATWFASPEYLNNINSMTSLKSKPWLWYPINSWWITKINNMDCSNFSVNQFCKLVELIAGRDCIYSDPEFVSKLEYGKHIADKGKMGEYTKLGSFQELLSSVANYVEQEFREVAKNTDKPTVVTDVTVAYGLMWATWSLLMLLNIGAGAVLFHTNWLLFQNLEENELIRLENSVDNAKTGSSVSSEKGEDGEVRNDLDPDVPAAQQLIDYIDKVPELEKFEG